MERLFPSGLRRETDLTDALIFCCGDAAEDYFAAGSDSVVYQYHNKVIKVYNQFPIKRLPSSDQRNLIEFYEEITNEASALTDKENWRLDLPLHQLTLPVRVVPVEKVLKCSCCGSLATVSRFVDGIDINSRKIKTFFNPNELRALLPVLSAELNKKLSVSGISIIQTNLKYNAGQILITDLCSQVSLLKKI